ncbi:unnamed protein product [Sphenostylis stenocarpa]|uniref:DUF4704 domain-containing protein n=1 Tax=Sphenostylis stenocarpa TaxID=92480 RepID=A0AA86RQB6_9FABA|nr:unnamed protein product [Sphenostylis stenocarpa]
MATDVAVYGTSMVARVLHLFYRLVVQPNASRAHMFAEEFLACGGIETLLVLLQREAKAGDSNVLDSWSTNPELQRTEISGGNEMTKGSQEGEGSREKSEAILQDNDQGSLSVDSGSSHDPISPVFASEIPSVKNLGGISLSISADSARKNVYNVDKSDGIVVGIIGLLGALVASGHLRIGSRAGPDTTSNLLGVGLHDKGGTMFEDKVSLLLYALQKAFQAAPNRLMTNNVYTSLLAASESTLPNRLFDTMLSVNQLGLTKAENELQNCSAFFMVCVFYVLRLEYFGTCDLVLVLLMDDIRLLCTSNSPKDSYIQLCSSDRIVIGIPLMLLGMLPHLTNVATTPFVESPQLVDQSQATLLLSPFDISSVVPLVIPALVPLSSFSQNDLVVHQDHAELPTIKGNLPVDGRRRFANISINASSSEDGLNFYDSGHRFEHSQLLLVLLHSLPFAPRPLQSRALQDLLFLACSHPENRSSLTSMEEWPEWILEILISNYEVGPSKLSDSTTIGDGDIEDLIHNFLSIMLEHSMRQKDGWKAYCGFLIYKRLLTVLSVAHCVQDIEATIHCAEWLSIVGGSSTGEQRLRFGSISSSSFFDAVWNCFLANQFTVFYKEILHGRALHSLKDLRLMLLTNSMLLVYSIATDSRKRIHFAAESIGTVPVGGSNYVDSKILNVLVSLKCTQLSSTTTVATTRAFVGAVAVVATGAVVKAFVIFGIFIIVGVVVGAVVVGSAVFGVSGSMKLSIPLTLAIHLRLLLLTVVEQVYLRHALIREESLPIFKRRLLGGLLDFSARELQVQTQIIAAAAAGVAAGGLSPREAKAEADNAAQLSVALVENAIVTLMLVEDHLRLQSKQSSSTRSADTSPSPLSAEYPVNNLPNSLSTIKESTEASDSGGVPQDVISSMADGSGQIPSPVMEKVAAAAAAEPYKSVSCAFVSYGSCAKDLADGWKYRSRLWYGVDLSPIPGPFGGGGSGWDYWKSALEKDENGNWIELPLVKKSVAMLQALLLDESGLGGGLGIGGGSGTGMGGMAALYQLLDSDQPFLCMLRMVLLSMREDDDGEDRMLMRNTSFEDSVSEGRKPRSALLWSVLSPVLNMPISDSKRQRVLVACCVLYSEVYHAVSRDQKPLRKQYLEAILPPFVGVLRRWRPILAAIHELATADGLNPLIADDRALAADSLPIEAALAMISPAWAAAFASPPASMALAMVAAGTSGGESHAPTATSHLRRDTSLMERKHTKLHTFSSFQKPLEATNKTSPLPKDKAAAKAAALAAARDIERFAKIGSGRGLSAVAMATAAQRRNASDMERVKRWNISEAMGVAWTECMHPVATKSVYGKDFNAFSYKYIAVLVASFALARNMQRSEIDRRAYVDVIGRHRISTGVRAWRKLIHQLIEMKSLFGPFADHLYSPPCVFWKLDLMESSSRMRRCLRRNYHGSDHLGSAANYDDYVREKNDQHTPILSAEAISLETVNEDDEQVEIDNLNARVSDDDKGDSQTGLSKTADLAVESALESVATQHAIDEELVRSSSAIAPGYVPSELDERIILELPSSMVRPLKVIRGTFQQQPSLDEVDYMDHMIPADLEDLAREAKMEGEA